MTLTLSLIPRRIVGRTAPEIVGRDFNSLVNYLSGFLGRPHSCA